jgi:hypothetical protein
MISFQEASISGLCSRLHSISSFKQPKFVCLGNGLACQLDHKAQANHQFGGFKQFFLLTAGIQLCTNSTGHWGGIWWNQGSCVLCQKNRLQVLWISASLRIHCYSAV